MFQYIISCKTRNKILLPDDRENLKLRAQSRNKLVYLIYM